MNNAEEIDICKKETKVNYKVNRRVTSNKREAYWLVLNALDRMKSLYIKGKNNKKDRKKKLGKEKTLPKFLKKNFKRIPFKVRKEYINFG